MSKVTAGAERGVKGPGAACPTAPSAHRGWFDTAGFVEPTLQELLGDPFILALMRSDGIEPSDIEALFDAIGGSAT